MTYLGSRRECTDGSGFTLTRVHIRLTIKVSSLHMKGAVGTLPPCGALLFATSNMENRTIRFHPAFREAIEDRSPRVSLAFLAEHGNVPRLTFLRLANGRRAQTARLTDHSLQFAAQVIGYSGPLFSGERS